MKTTAKANRIAVLILALLFCATTQAQDDLDQFIQKLKTSAANRGPETAFLSAGADFISGQEYFEIKEWALAAMNFKFAVDKEPANPYFNYQYAVALINQKDAEKTALAQAYLQKAFKLNPTLKQRYETAQAAPVQVANPVVQPAVSKIANNTPTASANGPVATSLDGYISRLKYSQANGLPETAMLSAGRDVLYGLEYFEKGEYNSAATNFWQAHYADKDHAYINYLLGVSLHAQGKQTEAAPLLAQAFAADGALKQRFATEGTNAIARYQQLEAAKTVKTTPATKPVYGGKLVFGDYNCTVTVWNGPGASPAYRHDPQGYFELKSNGTYRWLDNGRTGRYTYDAKTGKIKWLSGHFAAAPPKVSLYQQGTTVAQITLEFSDNYRWQCGCNK